MKKKQQFLLFLFPMLGVSQIAMATNSNDGYTYGDVYNNGQLKTRTQDSFQKDSTAISREERSDGTNSEQRKTFLTDETRTSGSSMYSSAKKDNDLNGSGWKLTNKATVKSKGALEHKYDGYSNGTSDKNFGQRTDNSKQRVLVAYKSNREDSKTAAQQDSTYIRKDADMDWASNRIIDCSTVKMKILEAYSCPTGTEVAENALDRWRYLSNNGYEVYNKNFGSAGYSSETQIHYWEVPSSHVWYKTVLSNGYVTSTSTSSQFNQTITGELVSNRSENEKGVSLYITTFTGTGKIYASSESECYKKINVNNSSTYSEKSSEYIHDNCAKLCSNNRSDAGQETRRDVISCATYDKVDESKGIYQKYISSEKATITPEYPQGTKIIKYTKYYLFNRAKGTVKVKSSSKVDQTQNSIVSACEAYGEEATTLYDCVRDGAAEAILRAKFEASKTTGGGSSGTATGNGGSVSAGGVTVTPKAEEIGQQKQTESSSAARVDGRSVTVVINGTATRNTIIYVDSSTDNEYYLDANGNKVYVVYENGVYVPLE